MKIELARSSDEARALINSMDRPRLIAQQIAQRAAIHAVEFLIEHGVTNDNANSMLESLREQLQVVQEVAHRRGIQLPSYLA